MTTKALSPHATTTGMKGTKSCPWHATCSTPIHFAKSPCIGWLVHWLEWKRRKRARGKHEAWLMERGEKKLLFNFKSKLWRPRCLFLCEISTIATISWFKLAFFDRRSAKKSLVRPFLSRLCFRRVGSPTKAGKLSAREALGQINWSRDLELIYTWPSACGADFLRDFLRSIKVARSLRQTSFTQHSPNYLFAFLWVMTEGENVSQFGLLIFQFSSREWLRDMTNRLFVETMKNDSRF